MTIDRNIERLLVGADDSPESSRVISWAVDLALACRSETTIVQAWIPQQAELPPDEATRERDEHRARIADDYMLLRNASLPVDVRMIEGDARTVLLDSAESTDADLIVVGRRGTGGFLGLGLGSVANFVLHHTTRPVAINTSSSHLAVGPIVVGIDGSWYNEPAVAWAFALGRQTGRDVCPVFAVETLADTYFHQPSWTYLGEPDARRELQRVSGGEAPPLTIVAEHPVTALLRVADQCQAAAVVVGRHGHHSYQNQFSGGIATHLLHHADVPVIVAGRGTP